MVKWVVGLVAAIVAALFGTAGVAAASAPALLAPTTYTYDGQHCPELMRDSALERGPPSTTCDYAVKLLAVHHGSDGASERPDTSSPTATPPTPQEKKALSYDKDRRNTYGENDKASRKAIPLRKRLVNRANRHDARRRDSRRFQ